MNRNIDVHKMHNVLCKKWFYVPSDFDELKFVDDIRNILNITLERTKGFSAYTILPTTDCNARCFYCFEANSNKISMSDEVANKTADYISKTCKSNSKIHVQWFGGEPLFNKNAISIICTRLNEMNISFDSDMVSNGFLFDQETIHVAKNMWNLDRVQITLDGTESVYNKTKAYIYKNVNPFDVVLKNIDNLLLADIDVVVRLNIDAYNMRDVTELVNFLGRRYGGKKGFSVYSNPLFEEVGKCNFKRTQERRKEICDYQKSLNELISSLGLNNSLYAINRNFMLHFCKADSLDGIIILPDGHLTKCDSCIDDNFVGNIDDCKLDENMLAKYKKRCEKIPECGNCPLYPDCIRLEVCHEAKKCHEEFRNKRISDLKEAVLNVYHAFLEREKENANNEDKVS